MHLTLKKEATKPAAKNSLQQQAKFDAFAQDFNRERPHQPPDMHCSAEHYAPSPRPYRGLERLEYPFHDRTITVTYVTGIDPRARRRMQIVARERATRQNRSRFQVAQVSNIGRGL